MGITIANFVIYSLGILGVPGVTVVVSKTYVRDSSELRVILC